MKKKYVLCFVLLVCAFHVALGIAPPKKGVKVPVFLEKEFQQIRSEYAAGYWAQEMTRRRMLRERSFGEFSPASVGTDTVRIPILVGYYPNLGSHITKQQLQQQLYDGPNATGTVTQFFTENSYGKFYVTGAVADWNSVPQPISYYAGTDGKNGNRRDFVIDILMETDSTFDFSSCVDPASNTDGYYHVRLLGVVHAGAGAEAGATNIWSHKWNIRSRLNERKNDPSETFINKTRVITIGATPGYYLTNDLYNGVPVVVDGDYACEPELSGSNNSIGPIIEIGVFCHEFGHIFGLPDLYDTDGSSEGLGQWCLMASGSWGGNGSSPELPTHMSAWCKAQLGWVVPTVVGSYLPHQAIPKSETSPVVYKLWKQGIQGNQYFLIENRQKSGFDQSLLLGGLLIFHVDNTQPNNTDENHYKVDLEQADGLRQLNLGSNRGDAGDPYPGMNENHRFDGFTTPNSKDYTNAQTYVGVRNISNGADTMYADLDVGTRPYLRVLSVAQSDTGQPSSNGRIEPNESGQLRVQIQNIHPVGATNAELRIIGSAQGATIDTVATIFTMGSLANGEVLTAARISLQSGFIPREVPLTLDVRATEFHETYPVTVTLGYPPLLILDGDSVAQSSVMYVRRALDSLSQFYEVLTAQDSLTSDAALSQRGVLVYLSGTKKYETIKGKVLDSLVQFFQRGGRVLLSGQNIAEDLQARSVAALSDVFHVRWSKNLAIGRYAYGVPSDPLGAGITMLNLAGGDGAANQTSPDILLADGVSVPCLTYGSVGGTNIAGLHVENFSTNSKLVFLGFGLEAINNVSSTTSRAATMQSILQWFDVPVGVSSKNEDVPRNWALHPAFPNPFNPSARIIFDVPRKARIEIALFNILGQKVLEICSSEMALGRHEAVIDGTRLSSGVYFCRMQSEGFSAIQKLMLMK